MCLGCISFGGPAAHTGYFHRVFVKQKKWLSDEEFANWLALCQFLPGPGSSQLGFAIGLQRGGLLGAIAAFIGFTLPSFVLMFVLALTSKALLGYGLFATLVQGLKILAVAVIAHACVMMFNKFCQSLEHKILMAVSLVLMLVVSALWMQMTLLIAAALTGFMMQKFKPVEAGHIADSAKLQLWYAPLVIFAVLFLITLWLSTGGLGVFSDFYQAGSLVFGGGHVVLPLLQQLLADSLSNSEFLTGYAAAQAVPGPMFSFATYLGAVLLPDHALFGAIVAILGVFLPGFLLLLGVHKAWQGLSHRPVFMTSVAYINAAVVGFLAAALFNPALSSALHNWLDGVLIIAAILALQIWKKPVISVLVALLLLQVMRFYIF